MAEDKRKIFALVHPGYLNTRGSDKYFKRGVGRGELDYPDEYIDAWKTLIDWIGKRDDAHLFLEEDFRAKDKFKEITDHAKDNLPEDKLTVHTGFIPPYKIDLKTWVFDKEELDEMGELGELEELDRLDELDKLEELDEQGELSPDGVGKKAVNRVKELKDELSGDKDLEEDSEDIVLFGCGEAALGCVSDVLNNLQDILDLPEENVFIHQDLSAFPLPEDAEDFRKYLQDVDDHRHPFGETPSVSPVNGKELKQRIEEGK